MDNNFDDKTYIKNIFNINYDINKLLLESKTLMKKLNFKKAYENLKLPISQGLSHADVYYLFGEICRILKKLEEAETYLLQCLKFEHHSPFVFYSLGLLYQEIEQYKYSVSFFKHFTCLIQTSDAFYQLAKSYFGLNKSLKSAIYITKAINLNANVYEFYKFRSELYDSMGFKELARDDKKIANKLNNII
jgi:tetratricopeptide (TPR) repeat protein